MILGIVPHHISFHNWAAQLNVAVPHLSFPLPEHREGWRGWANAVLILNPSLNSKVPIPSHDAFPNEEDWRAWGSFFTQIIQTI